MGSAPEAKETPQRACNARGGKNQQGLENTPIETAHLVCVKRAEPVVLVLRDLRELRDLRWSKAEGAS